MNTPTTSRLISCASAALMFAFLLASCGGGGDSGGAASANISVSKTLSWAPPDSYTDNSELDPESELREYYIYVNSTGVFSGSDDPEAVVAAVDSRGLSVTSFNLANVSLTFSRNARYYVSMRSVTRAGMISDFSHVVSFTL